VIKTLSSAGSKFISLAVLMIVLALVLPFAYRMDVGPGPDSIRAMTWDYIEASWYSGFRLWDPLDSLPYSILRLVFAVMVARVFVGKSTIGRAMFVGILAELQPVAVSAPLVYLIDWPGEPLAPLYIPIPMLFLIGGIILVYINQNHPLPYEKPVPATDEETEVGMKVVAIMQTVAEDLDDSGKRAWGKMLGTVEEANYPRKQEPENRET
jgi:hypothetical protein